MATETEDFLKHFGVMGMKWGHHRAGGGSSSGSAKTGPTRKELRGMNKVERAKDKAKEIQSIHTARKQLPKVQKDYQNARAQYKVEKKQIGSVAARRQLTKHENKLTSTLDKALTQTGAEFRKELLATALGGTVAGSVYETKRKSDIVNGRG